MWRVPCWSCAGSIVTGPCAEFLTWRVFDSLHQVQKDLDAWVVEYNQSRPHQALAMKNPLEAFPASQVVAVSC